MSHRLRSLAVLFLFGCVTAWVGLRALKSAECGNAWSLSTCTVLPFAAHSYGLHPDTALKINETRTPWIELWKLRAVPGALEIVAEGSLLETCELWQTTARKQGDSILVRSAKAPYPHADCPRVEIQQWKVLYLPLAPGFYPLRWERENETLIESLVAINP